MKHFATYRIALASKIFEFFSTVQAPFEFDLDNQSPLSEKFYDEMRRFSLWFATCYLGTMLDYSDPHRRRRLEEYESLFFDIDELTKDARQRDLIDNEVISEVADKADMLKQYYYDNCDTAWSNDSTVVTNSIREKAFRRIMRSRDINAKKREEECRNR